jgi:hypothetical protein
VTDTAAAASGNDVDDILIEEDSIVELDSSVGESRKRPASAVQSAGDGSDDDFEIIEMPTVTKKPRLDAAAAAEESDDDVVCLD